MTVVVYRDGVLASDSAISSPNGHKVLDLPKIMRLSGKPVKYMAWCGAAATAPAFSRWYKDYKQNPDKLPPALRNMGFNVIVVFRATRNGDVRVIMYEHEQGEDSMMLYDVSDNPYIAIGSGEAAALAALDMGATAQQAVEIACRRSGGCALPVHYVEI
jgi:hypothetical protein